MNSGHHKTIFSKRLGCLVAVGEHASSQGKANGAASGQFSGSAGTDWLSTVLQFVGVLTASCALVTLAWAGPVASTALPTSLPAGGQVAQGAASISQSGAVMNITQSTPKAVVNWNTFDIGQNAKVNIVQPGADAVMLNRVTSANPSQILGQLNANGQVVLVNPNGVLFGKDGSVNASNFTATTLGITDANFMAGNQQFERNGSTAAVVNQGRINTTGGYVALLGARVSNEGQINTQGGTAYLAAAETVKIPVSGSGRIKLELSPSRINAAVANGKTGTIVTEGGQVYMQAASLSTMVASIIQSGNIDTTGEQGGAVHLLADGGQIKVDGGITANNMNAANKGGDIVIGRDEETGVLAKSTDVSGAKLESQKGFVETSGEWLATYGTRVLAKTWLLDPTDITITSGTTSSPSWTTTQSGSTIFASDINYNLNQGTSVTIATSSTDTGSQLGDINVNADISKTSGADAKLTLTAHNGITVNKIISASGTSTGKLDVEMTANGGAAGTASKGLILNKVIDANGGVVTLTGTNKNAAGGNANSGVVFNAGSGITAGNFVIKGYQSGAPSTSNIDKNGIYFNGASTLKSTGASSLEGASNSQGNLGAGIFVDAGANLTLDSGVAGTMSFIGNNYNAGYRGIRLGGGGNATIGVTGNVSFEGKAVSGMPGDAVFLRANVTQQSNSTLTLKGGSVEVYQGSNVSKATSATNTTLNLGELPPVSSSIPAYANGVVNIGSFGSASLAADNINIVGSTSVDAKQGVLIQAASTLTAKNIYVKGSALGAAGGSATAKGIHLINGILNASNNITLDGTSTNVTGVALEAGSVTSSGGAVVIKATTTAGQYQGANIVVAVSGKSVEIKGNSTNHIGVNIGAAVTSTGGGVTIEGTSVNSTGVYVNNSVTSTAGDINITGISNKADGFYIGNTLGTSKVTSNNGAVSITGTSDQQRGVWLDGNATVDSKVTGSTPIANAGVTIKGKSNGSVANNNVGAQIQGAVTAAGKLSITGDTLGVGLYQGVNISKAVSGDTVEITGTSVKHIGVSIQNTGSVTSIGATPSGSSSIVIDGTSYGSAVAVQGVSVAGTVKGASLFVKGMTAGNIGVDINAAVESTVGDIKLTGTGGSNYDYGQGVWTRLAGTLKSAKAITIDGTATNGTSGNKTVIGAQIQGTVTAGTDISITGKNTSTTDKAGLLIENTIKSAGGNITVTAENTSGTNTALSLSAAGKLLTDDNLKVININTNGMALNSSAVVQAGSSSTGTVNIKTIGNNHISIGGVDVSSNSAASQELGITNTELGQIKAGNLVIGDTSKTGKITVSGAVSTLIPTGNLTLQTGGNIDLSQALTIALGKSLTLNGAGASSTISQANLSAGITADQVEFLGSNATVLLQPTSSVNKIGMIAGNVKSFALTNQRDLTVSTVKSTDGLTAKDNIVLTTTTALGTALSIAKKIESTNGNVEVNGTSSDATYSSYAAVKSWAVVKGKDVTMNAVALGTSGKTLGYYGAGDGGEFTASNILTLIGSSKNDGNGFYMYGGKLSAVNALGVSGASTKGQGVGFEKASSLNVIVSSGNGTTITGTASTAGQEAIGLWDVTLTNTAGSVTFTATAGDIVANTTNTLTQNGNGGVMLTTVGNGNITVPKIINNGTGNVVIAAGSDLLAGNGGGGQVKTVLGNTISQANTTPGKTYIYSGKAADTGVLTQLDSTNFSTLKVDGTVDQNADTNVAYNAGAGITGSTAPAQVMFREKVTIDTSTLVGTTVTRTYGDADTANSAAAALFLATKEELKGVIANTGIYETNPGGVNNIKISKSAVIDSLAGTLTVPTYSTSHFLNATTHAYGVLTSSKYTSASIAADLVKVRVEKKAITLTGATVSNKVYDQTDTATLTSSGALTAGGAISSDKKYMAGDLLTVKNTGAKFTDGKNVKYDSSGNVIAQGVSIQGLALAAGGDNDNYTVTDASNVLAKITPKAITLSGAIASNKVYDRMDSATLSNAGVLTGGAANSSDNKFYTGDIVTGTNSGAKFTEGKNVKYDGAGNVNAQGVTLLGLALDGADKGNYTVTDVSNMTAMITPRALTGSISGVITVYGTPSAVGVASVNGLSGDEVYASQTVVLTGQTYSGSNNLKAGAYTQIVDAGVGGNDAGNYTFNGTSSANYVVNKLALNTQIAGVTTTYGTTAATGAASVSGVLSGDKVDLGNAKATLVDAANSSSGQLKAGTYKQTVANGLSGDDAANYTAAPTSLANYVVTPKAIAATVTAADKVYDGNNVATLNANSAGILTGDVVNVLGATGTFASKNVARDGSGNVSAQTVTVTGSGVGLGGTDGANYTLTNATSIASTTAKITPKDLSVSGITASDKVYDGSTTAAINSANAVLAGVVTGDSVSVSTQSGVGNFADKNVAFDSAGVVTSQAVTVSGLSLNGAAAGNYNVSDKSGAKAKVLQRALSITGSVAQDKTVDGNTNAQVKPGQLVNLVAGESLVVSATGQFADAEIGTNKAVTTQYALANGANGVARNYTLAGEVLRAAILVASINPVQPIVNPSRTSGGGRVVVSGSGNSGAALGVADGEEEIISREECSVLNPEKCECQESTIAGVEMCFAPTLAANSKN